MTQFLPRRAAARASLISTGVLGALVIILALTATTIGPVLIWFLGLFVIALLWLGGRR